MMMILPFFSGFLGRLEGVPLRADIGIQCTSKNEYNSEVSKIVAPSVSDDYFLGLWFLLEGQCDSTTTISSVHCDSNHIPQSYRPEGPPDRQRTRL